jgi:signal peptidase I
MASSPGRARHGRPPVDHARRNARARFLAREVVLWVGAVTGLVCLTAAALAVFAGVTPLIFRSGSMSPGIPTGALALAETVPASEVAVGDVVSVPRADGVRVTHRVVETDDAGGAARSLVLKGDANPVTDPDPVVVAEADRVFWSTPRLGEWVDQAMAPGWVFVVGTLFGMLAMIGFRRPLAEELAATATADDSTSADEVEAEEARAGPRDGPRHAAGRHRTSGVAVLSGVVVLAVAASLTVAPPEPTLAAFADTAKASGTTTTGRLVPASSLTCSGGGALGSPTLTWQVPTPASADSVSPSGWRIIKEGTTSQVIATVGGDARSYPLSGSLLGSGTSTYRVQAVVGDAPWTSAVSQGFTVTLVTLGLGSFCGSAVT